MTDGAAPGGGFKSKLLAKSRLKRTRRHIDRPRPGTEACSRSARRDAQRARHYGPTSSLRPRSMAGDDRLASAPRQGGFCLPCGGDRPRGNGNASHDRRHPAIRMERRSFLERALYLAERCGGPHARRLQLQTRATRSCSRSPLVATLGVRTYHVDSTRRLVADRSRARRCAR